jgi:hypothetical protein
VRLPSLTTVCGSGHGVAVCPALGLLVTSDEEYNLLSVWRLPGDASGSGACSGAGVCAGAGARGGRGRRRRCGFCGLTTPGLTLVRTLGGVRSVAPMQFKFMDAYGWSSGYLAFASPSTAASSSSSARALLLVTDAGHDAVHLVDVVSRRHAGYLAPPGSIAGPRGVAASRASPLVAISAWKMGDRGDHVVVVYRSSGAAWEAVRVIGGGFGDPGANDGQLDTPFGLQFSGDGSGICVADWGNDRAGVFRVDDGGFVQHLGTGLSGPLDAEEVEGGWLVACACSDTVKFVSLCAEGVGLDGGAGGVDGSRPFLGEAGSGDAEISWPVALGVVPGLGLVVREAGNGGRLQVFATPDAVAMVAMSPARVAWMGAVARGLRGRRRVRRGTPGVGKGP